MISSLPQNTEAFAELGEWHKTSDEEKLITRKTRKTKESLKYLQRPREPKIRFADNADKAAWFEELGIAVPGDEQVAAPWNGITIWKGVVPRVPDSWKGVDSRMSPRVGAVTQLFEVKQHLSLPAASAA
jgi:hypothetical protein